VKLQLIKTIEVEATRPFNFDATFHKPDHFTSGDNYWEPGIRWQTMCWRGKQLGLKITNNSTANRPGILVNIYYNKPLAEDFINSCVNEITHRFNLDLDLSDFNRIFCNEKILGPIIRQWKGMRPGHPGSLYEYIIIGILLQNATIRRSINMFQSLLEQYGKLIEFDNKKLWCFWPPGKLKKVSQENLRALKLGYRAKSIKCIDDYFADNKIDEFELRQKTIAVQRSELLKLYGVGPATAWYLLFDVFHNWAFFDHISPWEQKIYSKLFFNRNPANPVPAEKLLQYFERYGEYKQLAVHYIWEDLWWKRKNEHIPWLEELIRI